MTQQRETHPLVEHLYRLAAAEDRAALAALRRGLQPDRCWDALRIVLPFVGQKSRRAEDDALLVAGLFALHPERGTLSLAKALRQVQRDTESESIERRFTALLSADRRDLPNHLRHAVGLIARRDPPLRLDWDRLYRDVNQWRFDGPKRRWAREYWTGTWRSDHDGDDATTESTTP
jgi:CRISPR system Cascade subunit CasB